MQYIKGIENYHNATPSAITLGKFDGLHQGHELLIHQVIQHQLEDGVVGIVFAFDMSNVKPDILLTNQEKAKRLEGRVDYFIDCPFDEEIASMEAEDFIEQVLVKRFHAKYIIVGTDFGFGYQKRGDYRMLQEYSSKYGYHVEVITKKCYEGREISSSYIKEELKKGNFEKADFLLGYDYTKSMKKHFDNKQNL